MLQVAFIRQNIELVKERLGIRNFGDISLVGKIIHLDDERKKLQFAYDETQSKINAVSKEIGQFMSRGEMKGANEKKEEVAKLKTFLIPINEKLLTAEKELQENLVKLPNLPHTSVPKGKTPEENEIVREGGNKVKLYEGATPHWDLAKKYDLIK